MCGIVGMVTRGGRPACEAVVQRMMRALAHRGPDGEGYYARDDVALAQGRLAIIDLATGDQPLFGPDGLALVANGEIYNYIELRRELSEAAFKTGSDCETPLHLYRRDGLDFTGRLRGMYAIALHDPARGRVVLARDPFGIKPLYFAETVDAFLFASEPQALLRSGLVAPALLPQKRDELLQLQFTTGRDTIFRGIQRVLPGEVLAIEHGRIVERRHTTALPPSGHAAPDEAGAAARLDRILADSVELHQRSDVPYGMFLSGGIDSSAVLAMMARLNRNPVVAFTAGFSGTAAADERQLAGLVARNFGARHTEIDFTETDFWRLLPQVAAAMDDPAADYATLPTYKLAAAAHDAGLKVILSGEGGDELFGGYGRYRRAMRAWWAGGRAMRRRGAFDGLDVLREPPANWRRGMEEAEAQVQAADYTRLQRAQAVDCVDWLPNDLLTKLDRCLMAHGVEGRTPFLDREVADFAFRLPDRLKVDRELGKVLLRRWLAERAPVAEPFSRKRGFTVPVGEWMGRRGAELAPLLSAQPSLREICRPEAVERLFSTGLAEPRAAFAGWVLLFYALWHRRHVEGKPAADDVFTTLRG